MGERIPLGEMTPSLLSSADGATVALDTQNWRMVAYRDGKTKSVQLSAVEQFLDATLYDNNLYVLSAAGITKITDAALGRTAATSWLTQATTLTSDPLRLVIDRNVYVLSTNGMLTTYFKGAQTSQVPVNLFPNSGTLMLATPESSFLFLADTQMNRIYVINRKDGSLVKTMKIGSAEPMVHAALGPNDTLYFLTKDNKIWKIQ